MKGCHQGIAVSLQAGPGLSRGAHHHDAVCWPESHHLRLKGPQGREMDFSKTVCDSPIHLTEAADGPTTHLGQERLPQAPQRLGGGPSRQTRSPRLVRNEEQLDVFYENDARSVGLAGLKCLRVMM